MTEPRPNHYALLMIEYGAAFVPLEQIARKYLALSPDRADRDAGAQRLPFPAFRAGTQKSPWMVSVLELARYLDRRHDEAAEQWRRMNGRAS